MADLEAHQDWAYETKYPAVVSSQSVILGGTAWDVSETWDAASPVTYLEDYVSPRYTFQGTDARAVPVSQQDILVDRLLDLDVTFEAEYYPAGATCSPGGPSWTGPSERWRRPSSAISESRPTAREVRAVSGAGNTVGLTLVFRRKQGHTYTAADGRFNHGL